MINKLVSIVTPCYNGEHYIGRFLESIRKQSYKNIELVIINDGSTDRTEGVVENYRNQLEDREIHLIYYRFQKNEGQAVALNAGLKFVKGEYLLWMDSDDTISDDFIEERVMYLEKNQEKAFCYGKAVCVLEDEPEKIISVIEKRKKSGRYDFFEDIINVNDVFFPGYMCRVSALDTVLHNREIYAGAGGQNAQLLLPLAWHFGEPGYVEKSEYKYYLRANSHSHSQDSSEKKIEQLNRYEKIVISTLENIDDINMKKYIAVARKKYARMRFGNAVDTRNPDLIRKYYKEIAALKIANFHDLLMLIKYTFFSAER